MAILISDEVDFEAYVLLELKWVFCNKKNYLRSDNPKCVPINTATRYLTKLTELKVEMDKSPINVKYFKISNWQSKCIKIIKI